MSKKVKRNPNTPKDGVELLGEKKQIVLINGLKVEAFIPKSLQTKWKASSD